ncbi:hypothetical protein Tco_1237410 [Tanacetum coccineum]
MDFDFQDSPDGEVEYQTRALLAKSKRFFNKGSQIFNIAKATKDTQCHKCGRNGHFAKLALLSPGVLASRSTLVKNKGLIAETCEWNKEDVLSDDNKVMEVKALMTLTEEEKVSVSKECARNREWDQISIRKKRILGVGQLTEDPSSSGLKDLVFIKSSVDNTKASIPGVKRPWLSEAEGFILPNYDTGRILPFESQRNSTDPPIAIIDSSETKYDLADKSSVCSTFFPPLKKPGDAKIVSEPKAVKTTLKSISTFKTEALKSIIPIEPSSAPAQENKKVLALKSNSTPAKNSKNVKSTDYLHLATVIK